MFKGDIGFLTERRLTSPCTSHITPILEQQKWNKSNANWLTYYTVGASVFDNHDSIEYGRIVRDLNEGAVGARYILIQGVTILL